MLRFAVSATLCALSYYVVGEYAHLLSLCCRWDEPDWGAEDQLFQTPIVLSPVVTASALTVGGALIAVPTAAH